MALPLEILSAEFRLQKSLAERAMAQLTETELLAPAPPGENSLVILVQHLAGNMCSRWTGVFTEDGEKPDRGRDAEFVPQLGSRKAVEARWEEGWDCLLGFLASIGDADLDRPVTVRGETMPLLASLVRQLGHYAYHVGQIVAVARGRCGSRWQTLTIPLGESEAFLRRSRSGG